MIRITKVYDYDCPICEHMSTFDGKVIFDLQPPTHMSAIAIDRLVALDNEDPHDCFIAQLVERYACNSDYTVDLPVYMLTEGKTYLGHVVGEHTAAELRTKLEGINNAAQNKESDSSVNS